MLNELVSRSGTLRIPLFHGTSTLFLSSILDRGLGGSNPIKEWEILELGKQMLPLCDEHLSDWEPYRNRRATFQQMLNQTTGTLNFQHGQTYLTPSLNTAIRYASNKRFGSEMMTYVLDFLEELKKRTVPAVRQDLYPKYPFVFNLLNLSPAPILIRVDDLASNSLLTESGLEPSSQLSEMAIMCKNYPQEVESIFQQMNFRLTASVRKSKLKISLINATTWHPLKPSYQLYLLRI